MVRATCQCGKRFEVLNPVSSVAHRRNMGDLGIEEFSVSGSQCPYCKAVSGMVLRWRNRKYLVKERENGKDESWLENIDG